MSRMVLQDKNLDAEARLDLPAGPKPSFDISLLEQREAETEYAARLSDGKDVNAEREDSPEPLLSANEARAQTPQTEQQRDSVGEKSAKAAEAYSSSLPAALKSDVNIKI